MFFNNIFLGSKSYRNVCVWIVTSPVMCVLPCRVFFNKLFSRVKVLAVFLHKLSGRRCVYWHAIYTKLLGYVFNNFFPFESKVITAFVRKLSASCAQIIMLLHISYRCNFFNNPPPFLGQKLPRRLYTGCQLPCV